VNRCFCAETVNSSMSHLSPRLRLVELVATLSIGTDLGTGHPMERAPRACLFALRLSDAFGCDETTLADICYFTLLRFAGCAADACHRAALFGDEIALGAEIDAVELSSSPYDALAARYSSICRVAAATSVASTRACLTCRNIPTYNTLYANR
jgi:hypothetical protein